MDDLTITRLCAEAIGIHVEERANDLLYYTGDYELMLPYNPLHDNAQAMTLVKKFELSLHWNDVLYAWTVYGINVREFRNSDLNRAICECVAKLKQGES